jgi:uncharacterized protein YdeI (BOF family)
MKQKFYLGFAIAATISILTTPILAQANTRIRDLQQPKGITISGKVISVVGNNFTLSDGTAEVIVDAGPHWWKQLNVSRGEQLTVIGKMDEGEFDAFSVTKSNGTVINIRPSEGPPPWAGKQR